MATPQEKTIPPLLCATLRKTQPCDQLGSFISASAISLLVYAKESGIEIAGRGFVIKHSVNDGTVDIEVCLPVSKAAQDRGDIKFREVPGPYDKMPDGHTQVAAWCQQHGFQWSQAREVYIKGPQETKDSSQYETELLYLQ